MQMLPDLLDDQLVFCKWNTLFFLEIYQRQNIGYFYEHASEKGENSKKKYIMFDHNRSQRAFPRGIRHF